MNLNDNDIIDILGINPRSYGQLLKHCDGDILEYLQTRYIDSESIKETIYRIIHGIEVRPVCPICGDKVRFQDATKGFKKYCKNCGPRQGALNQSQEIIDNRIRKTVNTRKLNGSYKHGEKFKTTSMLHYGFENPNKSQIVKDKIKNTCIEKYGTCSYLITKECKQYIVDKYGVDNYRKSDECKQKVSKYHKEHKDELNKKRLKTFNEKYGVENPMQIESVKDKFDFIAVNKKGNETKRKNNTFNKSKAEDVIYNLLKQHFGKQDIIRQYISEQYPYNCDFYIKSIDTYIEFNGTWTHGTHPFNENSEHDLEIVKQWENKNKPFYKNAIHNWTILDVTKRNIAKQNKINFIEFWNIKEVLDWINNQK
jgi:hypothetical protein